jgi:hypothetical protein
VAALRALSPLRVTVDAAAILDVALKALAACWVFSPADARLEVELSAAAPLWVSSPVKLVDELAVKLDRPRKNSVEA